MGELGLEWPTMSASTPSASRLSAKGCRHVAMFSKEKRARRWKLKFRIVYNTSHELKKKPRTGKLLAWITAPSFPPHILPDVGPPR